MVLLIVLIVVALLTIIVVEFTETVQLDRHRAYNAYHALQAVLLARSAINIEESFLVMDQNKMGNLDAFSEDWWVQLREFCKGVLLDPTMRIGCDLEDESGKLNVNATRLSPQSIALGGGGAKLSTPDAFARDAIRNLFSDQHLNIDAKIGDKLKEYWGNPPPNLLRSPDFTSVEEFAARFSVPTRYLRELRRVLTARGMTRININTAPHLVLSIVTQDNSGLVSGILARQNADPPFQNPNGIRRILQSFIPTPKDVQGLSRLFTVQSRLFRLHASGLANADPSGNRPGGVGQTLSVLVRRSPARAAAGSGPRWTLQPLDWQKEGGARLLEQRPYDENEGLGQRDDQRSDGSSTF